MNEPVKPKPYKVICISIYGRDLDRLDAMVTKMKDAGWTRMSRSKLIRAALLQVDMEKVPKEI